MIDWILLRATVATLCLLTLLLGPPQASFAIHPQENSAKNNAAQNNAAQKRQNAKKRTGQKAQERQKSAAKRDKVKRQGKKKRPTDYWPAGVAFDRSVPTPAEHFGFEVGRRHLDHAQIVSYMKAVANASSRVSVEQYGQTHGGRPLLLVSITSENNRSRMGKIQKAHLQLARNGDSSIELENLPAVINMGYGVHGDEPSATNCTPLVVHYLAAAQGPEVQKWLKNCVILLDPSLNPDGFNRFANWSNRYRGRSHNPDPQHAEHNQQWPPGRVNYYWFDLNRDWLPLVHPESRARMRWYHKWKPNVVLDFHEMGSNSTYFFQPGIPERTNPLTPLRNVELTNKFGNYHAKALDRRGSLYFTQEQFDDFYMGKGSTYPDLHGSVGILFEQASSRGMVQRNQDGLLHFHDTVGNQFTTSLSSLRATTDLRMELLKHKRKFYRDAMKMGKADKKQTYVFSSPNNWSRLKAFADVLVRHDIDCYWLNEEIEYGDLTFRPGADLIVPAAQPEYRFLRSLLMRRTDFQENIFYDVSSWTLPFAFGINQNEIAKSIALEKLTPAKLADTAAESLQLEKETIAYLIDARDDHAFKTLNQLLQKEVKVRVALKPFTSGEGSDFQRGTLSVPLGVQKGKRAEINRILRSAAQKGVRVTPIKTGLTPNGPDLGSNRFPVIKKRNVAMVTGRGVSAYGAGEVWHQLDTRVGMPVTMLKSATFASANLDDYTTIILPTGSYSPKILDKLKGWVGDGGSLIAIGRSAGSIAESMAEKTIVKKQKDDEKPNATENESPKDGDIQKPFDSRSTERALQLISGAIFRARADLTHPLLFGMENETLAVFRNHANMFAPNKNAYGNPLVYDEHPLMAGYCSQENIDAMKGTASVSVYPVGRGRVIMMADNPNFRGFWRGTSRIFMNAIFFGDFVDP